VARIHLVSPIAMHPWGPLSLETGIGGSETMQAEVAWHLAARGHEVWSYCQLDPAHPIWYRGVHWRDLDEADYGESGLWIIVRGLPVLNQFPSKARSQQTRWCVMQDVDLPSTIPWDTRWPEQLDRLIGLCSTHAKYLRLSHPDCAPKVCQSRNGIREDLLAAICAEVPRPTRHPQRLTYASSPDRGLMGLLSIWPTIRLHVPNAELHVFYGFDNMETLKHTAQRRALHDALHKRLNQPGVVVHGRTGQPDLYREWLKTGIMCAPTNFAETGYITLMEAQALGAVPICNPIWAAAEYQLAGIQIEGDGEHDPLTLHRYAQAAIYLLQHPECQDEVREAMMAQARKHYGWSGVIDQYEQWMHEDGI
jgi:hypothetical protein